MTRILYEGNDIVPWCTEVHLADSFRQLGHEMTFVPVRHSTEENLLSLLDNRPDVFLLTRPWGTTSGATPRFLEECAARGIPTAGFHLDRFWGLHEREQWVADQSDPLFCLDWLFSTDDGPEWADAGIRHHWMPPAVYGLEAYDADPDADEWPYDVAFVGSAPTGRGGNYHPEWAHRGELVAHLAGWYGDRFVHVGNGGTHPTLRGHALNVLYASVPVIVGDSCFVDTERPYWSDRVPETWGRGGFLVHPWVDKMYDLGLMPQFLPPWLPGRWDDLHDRIELCLELGSLVRNAARQRIATLVREHHTYAYRAQEILEVVL